MKIGISTNGFSSWGGGIDFISGISNCIEEADEINGHNKIILLPKDDSLFHLKRMSLSLRQSFKNLAGMSFRTEGVHSFNQEYLQKRFSEFEPNFKLCFTGSSWSAIQDEVLRQRIDCLLPCFTPPEKKFSTPWIGYIYDFQHKYYPNFFNRTEIQKRDLHFDSMLKRARHIIVNSHAVKSDALKFFPKTKCEIHVIPFCPSPRESWFTGDCFSLEKFKVKKPYFVICNQFWQHKDHMTAFKAFEIFKKKNPEFTLVCTGQMHDYRAPQQFMNIERWVKEHNLADSIIFLGHLSKFDQVNLLRDSTAAIQPTLFEGGPGGGMAQDSIALGKPIILSDIAVNKEIQDTNTEIYFFITQDHLDLARRMEDLAKKNNISISIPELLIQGKLRRKKAGNELIKIIKYTVASQR